MKSNNYITSSFKRFFLRKSNIVFLIILSIVLLYVTFGNMLAKYNYDEQIKGCENIKPLEKCQINCERFLFGTDNLGRNMFARISKGTQISLIIGIGASLISLLIGGTLGLIGGYYGGKTDAIIMKMSEFVTCVPDVLIVILLSTIFKPILLNYVNNHLGESFPMFIYKIGAPLISLFCAFTFIYWTSIYKIVRGQAKYIKNLNYIKTAKVAGENNFQIILKHIFPNSLSTIITITFLQIPTVIFLESFLSFLGLGINTPLTSLGELSSVGLNKIYSGTYLLLEPILMLIVLIFTLNYIGNGLRDAFDVKIKKVGD